MNINLNKELGIIVNDNVEYYKEDLNQDLDVLLDKNKAYDTFIFLVRKSGTHLYEKEKLFVEEAGERAEFLYFKDSFSKAFEVNVTKRGTKYVYGDIKELNLKTFIKDVSNKSNSNNKVSVKIIKNDDTVVETTFLTKDSYYTSLEKNNLTYEDIKKIYYLEFFN